MTRGQQAAANHPSGLDPTRRHSARVVIVDAFDRVLLFRGGDPARPTRWVWHMPGGGLEPGESETDAARREVREETGLHLGALEGPVWSRRFVFSFDHAWYDQSEIYFFARVTDVEVDESGQSDLERRYMSGYRWWSLDDIRTTDELIAPADLADHLPALLAGHFPDAVIEVAGALAGESP